jgi:hypothetical protein
MTIVTKTDGDGFEMQLDRTDLVLLANALNEVCNGIDSWEFSTRTGSSREVALGLLQQLRTALEDSSG